MTKTRRSVLFTAVLLSVVSLTTVRTVQPEPLNSSLLAGLRWRSIGPANMSGRIVDLAVVESNPYTFYAASATGGLWKTTDNGVTFTPLFEREAVHSIGCLAIDQAHPEVLWVGSGERANRQSSSWGDGVYKSTDAGKTWTNMGLRDSHHIGRIVIHPTNPDIVYVAAAGHLWGPNQERGLFKTTDGGKTWTNILFINEDTGVIDVAMDPSAPDVLYAAAYQRRRRAFGFHGGGAGSGLHQSIDGGKTWRRLTSGMPKGDMGRIGISIYRKDPRIVYVSIEQGVRYNASTAYEQRLAGIYRSDTKGETWQHMSDWNPRPMYASQILVDPNDDKRIYMVNAYSFSDDGGKTFTTPRQSLHGDDRIVWVNPRDSRHVIKGDDGGVGISYDRGLKWLYVTSLPISQFYRVAVDMKEPYWVYGGLQDNGCWAAPSATYYSPGILNEDWVRTCGGDGFRSIPDPADNRTVYSTSQYLGLTRVDMITRESRDIRPGSGRGHISARRNWVTWGKPGVAEPTLGNAMVPANWDAPFILSPHDPRTIYAGTNELWKSTDRGDTWVSLGNRTTGVDRSTLKIMGQTPNESTLSLDDGIPYYPTLTAIAESPLKRGVLYAGTDDGNVQVSRDDGKSWTTVTSKITGLPPSSWVSGLEASRYQEGTVYVSFDNHASDDYENHLYRSTDHGSTWTSIAGDLPARRVIRAVHEDPKNPDLLYIATELGFFLTIDRGARWTEVTSNLPRLAINDFAIHPRDNDLVMATHGRGLWILDNISALQELTPAVLASDAHLFTIERAKMIRYSNPKAHMGDMVFRGQNPPAGAIIDYYLGSVAPASLPAEPGAVTLSVRDAGGKEVRKLDGTKARGLNRVIWDLRHEGVPGRAQGFGDDDASRGGGGLPGPLVVPGLYTVTLVAPASLPALTAGGRTLQQKVEVVEDPRLTIDAAERRQWTEILLRLGEDIRAAAALSASVGKAADGVKSRPDGSSEAAKKEAAAIDELRIAVNELSNRLSGLYGAIGRSTAPPTSTQQSQWQYLRKTAADLQARLTRMLAQPVGR